MLCSKAGLKEGHNYKLPATQNCLRLNGVKLNDTYGK
jgi:hypothetical protein